MYTQTAILIKTSQVCRGACCLTRRCAKGGETWIYGRTDPDTQMRETRPHQHPDLLFSFNGQSSFTPRTSRDGYHDGFRVSSRQAWPRWKDRKTTRQTSHKPPTCRCQYYVLKRPLLRHVVVCRLGIGRSQRDREGRGLKRRENPCMTDVQYFVAQPHSASRMRGTTLASQMWRCHSQLYQLWLSGWLRASQGSSGGSGFNSSPCSLVWFQHLC